MYTVKRTYAYFRGELNKFIKVIENHARNEKTQLMPEFESIQQPNYNQIACDSEGFCQGLHGLEATWRD